MSSFSRSGETLLLRCLNAHPEIAVVHQVLEPDDPKDMELFRFLMTYPEMAIDAAHPALAHRNLEGVSVLVLKNAVWTHDHPRLGFTLARNPFSVAVSAFRHVQKEEAKENHRKQQIRWSRTIDEKMVLAMKIDSTLTSMLMLYNRKMLNDRREGLPFVRYEDFIREPREYLQPLIAYLGLTWDEAVLRSHENYKEGDIGHGRIKLWLPIHSRSLNKFQKLPPVTLSHIYGMTHETLLQYGYEWTGDELILRDVAGMLGRNVGAS